MLKSFKPTFRWGTQCLSIHGSLGPHPGRLRSVWRTSRRRIVFARYRQGIMRSGERRASNGVSEEDLALENVSVGRSYHNTLSPDFAVLRAGRPLS